MPLIDISKWGDPWGGGVFITGTIITLTAKSGGVGDIPPPPPPPIGKGHTIIKNVKKQKTTLHFQFELLKLVT